ncbi:MAG: hypothetical protein IKZ82_08275 [Clostridia bacterium]|nr:hypothetical protein [Clostridia bacterium]
MNKKQPKYTPRRLARSVARANMQAAGIERVNRRFDRWREWVLPSKANRWRTAATCKLYEIDKNGKLNELCDARIE